MLLALGADTEAPPIVVKLRSSELYEVVAP